MKKYFEGIQEKKFYLVREVVKGFPVRDKLLWGLQNELCRQGKMKKVFQEDSKAGTKALWQKRTIPLEGIKTKK